jgi:hypothetical protein
MTTVPPLQSVTDVTPLWGVSRHVTLRSCASVTCRDKCHALSRHVTLLCYAVVLRTFYPAAPECMSHFGRSLSDSDGGSYRSDAATVRGPRPPPRSALDPAGDSLDDLEPPGGAIDARSALATITDN